MVEVEACRRMSLILMRRKGGGRVEDHFIEGVVSIIEQHEEDTNRKAQRRGHYKRHRRHGSQARPHQNLTSWSDRGAATLGRLMQDTRVTI